LAIGVYDKIARELYPLSYKAKFIKIDLHQQIFQVLRQGKLKHLAFFGPVKVYSLVQERFSYMKFLVLLLLCTQICMRVHGQDGSLHPNEITCDARSGCDSYYRNGRKVFVIKNEKVIVSVTMMTVSDNYAAAVGVTNLTDSRIDIFPSQFKLSMFDPKKPKKAYNLPFETAERITRNDRIFAFIAGSIMEVSASMQKVHAEIRTESYGRSAIGDYSGTSETKVAMQDVAARERVISENQEWQSNIEANGRSMHAIELQANTVFPKQSVAGYVYFVTPSRFNWLTDLRLTIPFGDSVFTFPLKRSDFMEQH